MSGKPMIDFTRVFDLVDYQIQKFPQSRSLNSLANGKWEPHSIQSIKNKVDLITAWLLAQDVKKGNSVAVIPRIGSPEWMMIDFAIMQAGLIIVPIHPTSTLEEMEFIIKETEAILCITIDAALHSKVQTLANKLPTLRQAFHLEPGVDGYFPGFLEKDLHTDQRSAIEASKAAVLETDVLAIMYTSGTSGISKGAVLSHRNVASNIKSILSLFPLVPGQRVLSFLPYSHIFERTTSYAYMAFGVEIYFSQKIEKVLADFKTVRPHFCTMVPRTLEKMYNFLLDQKEGKSGLRRLLISWAMGVGENYKDAGKLNWLFAIQLAMVRLLVLNRWRRSLGGHLRFVGVGAAALHPDISKLFSASKIMTLPGYGMTEASPFISVNRYQPGLHKFGTVGIPVPGVDIKLENPNENGEGEILVKGPNIMQGYFKRPEMTQDAFTPDGWFRTGDVGKWIDTRFLSITDRKKDIFKTSSGKYVAPQPLENHFCSSSFIIQCLILGFNRPYVTAIIVPNFPLLQQWSEQNGIHWTSPTFMVHNIKVVKKMKEEIDRLNATLQGFERVRDFILSDEEWTVENKDLTTSFKPKRNHLLEKYKSEIEKMYKNS